MMGAVFELQIRQIFAGKKIWIMALFLLFPVGLTILLVSAGGFSRGREEERLLGAGIYLFFLYPVLSCVLSSLLHGGALLSSEVEGKTVTYLFTRPVSKMRIIAAKYAATALCIAVVSMAGFGVSWTILGAPGGGRFAMGYLAAITAAAAAYTAIFAVIGVLVPKRVMVIGLIYAILVEGILSFMPAMINRITVLYHVRSLVLQTVFGSDPAGYAFHGWKAIVELVGNESATVASVALAILSACALGLAVGFATKREYVVADHAA